MLFKDDHLAARQEAFRRKAPNRKSRTFGPEFDEAFKVWDDQRRLRRRLIAALSLLAIGAVGGLIFLKFSPGVAQDACLDGGGRWVSGQCERTD